MGSENNVLVINMARAVHYQLSYINTVSRTDVLAESYFKLPAIDYIERHPNLGYNVFLEYPHPVFKYRRIDISWGKGKAEAPSSFMEMKFVKAETAGISEQQRFYNDLARLAAILAIRDKTHCFFLASGLKLNWEECFINTYKPDQTTTETRTTKSGKKKKNNRKVKSIYQKWFSFDSKNPGKIISIKKNNCWNKAFLDEYETREETNKCILNRIKTRLLWISEADSNSLQDNTMTAIWEIKR